MSFNPEMLVVGREAKGLTQEDLSNLLNVSQGTVSRWESGLLEPGDSAQGECARYLDLTSEFFHRSDRVYGFNSTVFFHRRQQSAQDLTLRKLHARMNLLRMRIASLLRSSQLQTPQRFESFDVEEYDGKVE